MKNGAYINKHGMKTSKKLDQIMKVISANQVTKERLKEITEEIEHKSMEGEDDEFFCL